MTWTDRVRSLFNRGAVNPPLPQNGPLFWPVMTDADGSYFGAQQALQLSVVWACVSVISRSIAACEWKVYEKKDGRLDYLEEDPLDYLLNTRPNPEMTAVAFKEALVASAAVWGGGYAEIRRDKAGRVAELWPLNPERTEPYRKDADSPLLYKCSPPDTAGEIKYLPAADVYHLRGPSLVGYTGENMVWRSAKSLVLTAAADAFATSYYRNNTVIGGVLEHPKTLDPQTHKRLRDDWVEKHAGPGKAYKPVILENGMQWRSFNDTSAQSSQMLEARKFQVEEIARWFGVPLHMIGSLAGSQGYGTNLEQLGLGFVRDCLTPWARRMEQEADWKLFPMRGPGARKQTRIDLSPMTKGDFKTRMDGYAVGFRLGVWSINDILRREGENGIGEEGDKRFVEASLLSLEEVDLREDKAEKELTAPPPAPFGAPRFPPGAPPEEAEDEEEEPEPEGDGMAAAVQSGLLAIGAGLARKQPEQLEFIRDAGGQVVGAKFKE